MSPAAPTPIMKILYLVHRVPFPPDRGDRIRSYHLLKYLAGQTEVDLACLADEPVSREERSSLEQLCRRVCVAPLGKSARWLHAARSLAVGLSASEGLFYSRRLAGTVSAWSRDTSYDCVIAFCSSMRAYLDLPQLDGARRVVDLVDVDSQKWFDYAAEARGLKRWLFCLEGRRVRKLECQLARRAELILTVSRPEAELLRRFAPAANVRAVPNGVDLDYFAPRPETEVRRLNCVFVGALDYRANVEGIAWFCREVWPMVQREFPSATLSLVGRNPVTAVRKLADICGVEVVGQVPDVRPYLARAAVAVVPLRVARGIQNKVLEAAAMGKATICSGSALEGLELSPGKETLRADEPREWVAALAQLLHNDDEAARLGAAARAFVERRHCWQDRLSLLDELFEPRDRAGTGATAVFTGSQMRDDAVAISAIETHA